MSKEAGSLFGLVRESRLVLATLSAGIGAGLVVLALASIVSDDTLQLTLNLVVTPLATLWAAYAGAKCAFGFQAKKDRETEIAKNVRAANSTIFQLVRYANLFHIVEEQYIAEHRNNLARHFQIDPGMEYGVEEIRIDFEPLAFLFQSPHVDLLRTLGLVQLEVNSTVSVIRQRRKLHVETFQVAMDGRVPTGVDLTSDQVQELVGERIAITLMKMTDDVIGGVDASIDGLRYHIDALREAVKAMYPAHGVVLLKAPSA